MGEVPGQLEHLLGVNELRIAVEQGPVPLGYCFAHWQLADLGWPYPVIPDLAFAVRAPDRRTFLAEYDRGTETMDKLLDKVRQYAAGLDGFPFEAVLLVTEEGRRFEPLGRAMRKEGLSLRLLVSSLGEVQKAGVFGTEFVEFPDGTRQKILQDDAGGTLLSESPSERRG